MTIIGTKYYAKATYRCSATEGERTGTFTSGIVSIAAGRQIALFFTGAQHAGENLADVLARRASGLPPPIQMCDGRLQGGQAQSGSTLLRREQHGDADDRTTEVDISSPGPTRSVLALRI